MTTRKPLVLVSGRPQELAAADAVAGTLTLLGTGTVGESGLTLVALAVRSYTLSVPGAAVGDRIVAVLTGAPTNGFPIAAWVSSAGAVAIRAVVPILTVGTISIPLAIYKVTV